MVETLALLKSVAAVFNGTKISPYKSGYYLLEKPLSFRTSLKQAMEMDNI